MREFFQYDSVDLVNPKTTYITGKKSSRMKLRREIKKLTGKKIIELIRCLF
jgi:hypothetical protein